MDTAVENGENFEDKIKKRAPQTRFILIETSHAGNVGAAARAMKTMGFTDLFLVRPRWHNVLRREETIQRASGALDVLSHAKIVDTLDEALHGMTHLCATAMVSRDFGPPSSSPRAHLSQPQLHNETGIAFLFGGERFGMKNDNVYRCHTALQIPSNPQFGSLNLASAVQLIAYEWRQSLGGFGDVQSVILQKEPILADAQETTGMLQHWESALIHMGFLDKKAPKKLMPRLQQLFNRSQLTQEEIHILRGIAKAMLEMKCKNDIF